MKTIFTSLVALISSLILATTANAQTTYNITSNANWSTFTIPTTCSNCTINISTGVTLTIDKSVTCQNCTIAGGNVSITNFTLNIQYAGPVTTTNFNNNKLTINGTGKITVNAPLAMTNSSFTFYGTSTMTNSYQFDMTNSYIDLYGNSKWTANGGPVNMMSGSDIAVGDGSVASTATFLMNGPTLNIYGTSKIAVGNDNNTYQNWSTYNTAPTVGGTVTSHSSYNGTPSTNMNCGAGYAHACSNPNLYGPSSLSAAGTVQGPTILPITLEEFNAELNSNATIGLSWTTAQESNSSHFDIERSTNGSEWNKVGEVAAKGNAYLPSLYAYTDENPSNGNNYYRLKMIDLDGRSTYSAIRVIARASLSAKVSFFPNPAHDYVNVALSGSSATQVTVRLLNQAGQVLQERIGTSGNGATVSFPVQQYPTGLYILSVVGADGTHESSKLLINRS
ncbi:MAG: T9SS type A sorting domain-containing protein [Bacteroidota bacterium]|nr:T9SS type A sorting domain-containing protein [Bacteroidota bacterium]